MILKPGDRGGAVQALQRKMAAHTLKLWTGSIGGTYGGELSRAVMQAKFRLGYRVEDLHGYAGPTFQHVIGVKFPADLPRGYRARAKRRLGQSVGENAADILEVWCSKGWHETGSDNKVPAVQDVARDLGLADYYVNMGWPWCLFLQELAALVAGGLAATDGLVHGTWNALYTVDAARNAIADHEHMRHIEASQARRGTLAMVDFGGDAANPENVDHAIRLRSRPVLGWALVCETVEGNTSSGDGGDQADGGGAYLRVRRLSADSYLFIEEG